MTKLFFQFSIKSSFVVLIFFLSSCYGVGMRPINSLNYLFSESSNSLREPILTNEWLVTLSANQGKEKIELFNLRTRKKVPLPGLNRADAQPISVSISANGERLAVIRQRSDKTELVIYRRRIGTIQRLEITPKGVPRRVSLDGLGKRLAVQISRNGRWDVEVIRVPG